MPTKPKPKIRDREAKRSFEDFSEITRRILAVPKGEIQGGGPKPRTAKSPAHGKTDN